MKTQNWCASALICLIALLPAIAFGADDWKEVGPGVEATRVVQTPAAAGATRELSAEAKTFAAQLAEIIKNAKAPEYPALPAAEGKETGGWGGGGGPAPSAPRAAFKAQAANSSGSVGVTAGGMKDIGLARKMIAEGQLPYPESFSVEGLISEHDIALGEAPKDGGLLYPAASVAYTKRYGHKDPEAIVQIGFGANVPQELFERPALNLAVVIDCSGSMQGKKIEAARKALLKLLSQLNDKDRFALVCFDNQVWVPAPAALLTAEQRKKVEEVLDKAVMARGSTDIHSGLKAGFEQVAAGLKDAAVLSPRVILITDEQPNTGRTKAGDFISLLEGAASHGIGVSAFGVGADFGQDLAYKIFQVRGANYHFLQDDAKLAKVFDDEFKYLVTPVAYDVKIALEPKSGGKVTDAMGVPEFFRAVDGSGDKVVLSLPTLFFSARQGGGATAVCLRVPAGFTAGKPLAEVALEFVTTGQFDADRAAHACKQNLRVSIPANVKLDPARAFFGNEGVRKAMMLTDLACACKAATQGVKAPPPDNFYWALPAGAKAAALERHMPPPTLTTAQAADAVAGFSLFLNWFASQIGGLEGVEAELRMAEKLEATLCKTAGQAVPAARKVAERVSVPQPPPDLDF